MNDMNNLKERKARYFLERNINVHISCHDKIFYNGFIKEVSVDFLILIDRKVGELPLFFSEIINIEPFNIGWGED